MRASRLVHFGHGPVDGRCAVLSLYDEQNMYRVFCRDWKGEGSKKEVTDK